MEHMLKNEEDESLTLLSRLECNDDVCSLKPPHPGLKQSSRLSLPKMGLHHVAKAILKLLVSSSLPDLASQSVVIAGRRSFAIIGQAGLELLTWGDPLSSASQSAGITDSTRAVNPALCPYRTMPTGMHFASQASRNSSRHLKPGRWPEELRQSTADTRFLGSNFTHREGR
ncbi:hypothetical protein AAY473_031212 [Plecturocebus cupreus]